MWYKGTLTVQGVITVWLVSSFTGLDSSQKDDMLLFFMKESDWIQTSQTGDELYNDTKSPYGEWSPVALTIRVILPGFNSRFRENNLSWSNGDQTGSNI